MTTTTANVHPFRAQRGNEVFFVKLNMCALTLLQMELVYLLLRGIHTVQQTLQCDNPKTLFFFPAAELFLVGWIVWNKKMYHIYDAQKIKMAFGYQK